MKRNVDNILICLIIYFLTVQGLPVKRDGSENKMEFKDEKRYPNGTIIGKYTYRDKEGNPVHVKYFADDASYGVELKSVKVFDSNPEQLQDKLPKLENMMSANILQPFEAMSTINTVLSKDFDNNTYNPFEILKSYPHKVKTTKGKKTNDDYEIFQENDLRPFNKCNKEKVKVYIDKNKRKVRNVINLYNPSAYCERV